MQRNAPRDLPDALELPLATGAPYWYWLGGRPALDLANTLRERWDRRVETLVTPDDLGLWLAQAGVVSAPLTGVSDDVLAEARALREAIDALVVARVDGRAADPAAVAVIDGLLKASGSRPRLTLADDGTLALGTKTAERSPRRALGAVALDAARMLGEPDQASRVRICASETCSARFYDRSPARARRWCSMQTCGNASKVRAHRARGRAQA